MGFLSILRQLRKKFALHLKNRAAEWMDAMCASTLLHYPIPIITVPYVRCVLSPYPFAFSVVVAPSRAGKEGSSTVVLVHFSTKDLFRGRIWRGSFSYMYKGFFTWQGGRFGTVHKFSGRVVADSINCTHKLKVFWNACNKKWLSHLPLSKKIYLVFFLAASRCY